MTSASRAGVRRARVWRQLDDSLEVRPQCDPGLAAIVAALSKLPPVVRAGVVSAVEGFAEKRPMTVDVSQ